MVMEVGALGRKLFSPILFGLSALLFVCSFVTW
jgi:hypothetical protein